jgi:hypothetical protein
MNRAQVSSLHGYGHNLGGQSTAMAIKRAEQVSSEVVTQKSVSVALACRTFGVSETCYRYGPKLKA